MRFNSGTVFAIRNKPLQQPQTNMYTSASSGSQKSGTPVVRDARTRLETEQVRYEQSLYRSVTVNSDLTDTRKQIQLNKDRQFYRSKKRKADCWWEFFIFFLKGNALKYFKSKPFVIKTWILNRPSMSTILFLGLCGLRCRELKKENALLLETYLNLNVAW